MKKLIPILLLFGCTKEIVNNEEKTQQQQFARSPFPTSISLGADTSYFRVDSVCLYNAVAYLDMCGVAPAYEAPSIGTEIYQIAGPNQAICKWENGKPTITGLIYGTYTIVGRAWVLGYRICDETVKTDNVFDTINITINKNKRKQR
jgi:hypothetical protein